MNIVTNKRMAWVSAAPVWQAHEKLMPSHVCTDWYLNIPQLLKAVCDHAYDCIAVHMHLLQPVNMNHVDLGSLIRTMCHLNSDHPCHVVLIVDGESDHVWLKTAATEGYQGMIPTCDWQHVAEFNQALQMALDAKTHWPKKMWTWFQPRKVQTTKPTLKLTPRQQQVLHMIQTRGASNKLIAKQLKISESTVKVHIGAIMKKFGVRNRTQLAVSAIQQKM